MKHISLPAVRHQAIPDSLLTDKQAITWQYRDADEDGGSGSGTTMTALAVPQAVQDQVMFVQRAAMRCDALRYIVRQVPFCDHRVLFCVFALCLSNSTLLGKKECSYFEDKLFPLLRDEYLRSAGPRQLISCALTCLLTPCTYIAIGQR